MQWVKSLPVQVTKKNTEIVLYFIMLSICCTGAPASGTLITNGPAGSSIILSANAMQARNLAHINHVVSSMNQGLANMPMSVQPAPHGNMGQIPPQMQAQMGQIPTQVQKINAKGLTVASRQKAAACGRGSATASRQPSAALSAGRPGHPPSVPMLSSPNNNPSSSSSAVPMSSSSRPMNFTSAQSNCRLSLSLSFNCPSSFFFLCLSMTVSGPGPTWGMTLTNIPQQPNPNTVPHIAHATKGAGMMSIPPSSGIMVPGAGVPPPGAHVHGAANAPSPATSYPMHANTVPMQAPSLSAGISSTASMPQVRS